MNGLCPSCGYEWEEPSCDVYCHTHHQEKPMSEYGIRYGGCNDCSGESPTFDDALGAIGDAQQRMADAVRLKR